MTAAARCDQCKFYRPIAALYAQGDRVGECRPGPASFRGIAHQGEGFLSMWPHTRAHWECGAFVATDGVQPFAGPREQPDSNQAAVDFPLPATAAPADVEPAAPSQAEPGPSDPPAEPPIAPTEAAPEPAAAPEKAATDDSATSDSRLPTPDSRPQRPVVRGNRK